MALHKFTKGLDLPIAGAPEETLDAAARPSRVAVVALDFPGMKPSMHVAEGDSVRVGQPLFSDKKTEGVQFASPASGTVIGVHRGAKRALQSVVIQLDGDGTDAVRFTNHSEQHPSALSRDQVRDLLLESGEWIALKARPYGRVADPAATPKSIFVTATDSNPLAPNLAHCLAGRDSDLERGLAALTKLTDGTVYFCTAPESGVEAPALERVQVEEFAGPHPAGATGTHVHTLDPVDRNKLVWTIGLQDVLAIGKLFATGELDLYRVVAVGGPLAQRPRHLKVRVGHDLDALLTHEIKQPGRLEDGTVVRELDESAGPRVIAGSVLSGRQAQGEVHGYLGRYDQQVSILAEDSERELLGWMGPGIEKFSLTNLFASALMPGKKFKMTTTTHGSPRAIVPIGLYEKVVPLDIVPTFLLKALVMGDVERAEELGALELVEEDLSLCTFVCPGKTDYGPYLRDALTILEKEG